jgi:hypothetical protein
LDLHRIGGPCPDRSSQGRPPDQRVSSLTLRAIWSPNNGTVTRRR